MADENEQEQSVTSVWLKQEAGQLSGDDIFYLVQGTGSDRDRWLKLSTLSAYIASGGVEEMTLRRLNIGGAYWENRQNVGPVIEGLRMMQSAEIRVQGNTSSYGSIRFDTNGAVIDSFYSISANALEGVTLTLSGDGTIGGNLGVTGDVTVGGGLGVTGDANITGDVSADDVNATGKVTADGGVESTNGNIKTTNGTVEGNTLKANNKLTLGDALKFVIDNTSGHTASDAETWLANTAPQNSIVCIVNDNTSGVTLWSDERQVNIIGKTAMLCIKIGTAVYPIMPSPNS